MIFLITSSLLGAVNFITTTIQLRAPGLTFMRFPFFVWAQFVTAFLLLLTSALQPSAEVLPGLALLPHTVRILPATGSALLEAPPSDAIIVGFNVRPAGKAGDTA